MPQTWRGAIVQHLTEQYAIIEELQQQIKMQDDKIDYLLNRINKLENRCAECGQCDGGCQK